MLFHDAKLACELSMLSILNVHRLSERLALVLNIWMKEYVAVMGLYMIITGQTHDVNGTLCAVIYKAFICPSAVLLNHLCFQQWQPSVVHAGELWWIWYVIGGDTGCYTSTSPATAYICLCECLFVYIRPWVLAAIFNACCCEMERWDGFCLQRSSRSLLPFIK